jgi:hypothetical protein
VEELTMAATRYLPARKVPSAPAPALTIDARAFSTSTLRGIERDLAKATRDALRRRDFAFAGPLNSAAANVMRAIIARGRERG